MKRFKRILRQARQALLQDRSQLERQCGDERRAVGDWVGAATHYRRHVVRNPRDMGIWVQLGHALKESGQYDEAEAAYRSAHLINDVNADLFLSRGHLAKLRRDVAAATEFYNRSFLIDGNPDAARELAQLVAGATAVPDSSVLRLAGAMESFNEGVLVGWVVDPEDMDRRASVEILHEGVVVGVAHGDVERTDLVAAGLAGRPAGFRFDLTGLELMTGSWISARTAGTHQPLSGSPMVFKPSEAASAWLARHDAFVDADRDDLLQRSSADVLGLTLSIFVDLEGAKTNEARRLLDSLDAQWSGHWELLYSLGGKPPATVSKLMNARATDLRIRPLRAASGASAKPDLKAVLAAARGDYIVSLEADAVLEPEAAFRILDAAKSQADIIYWDDVRIGASVDSILRFVTRPAFSWDHFLGHPKFFGSVAVRRNLLETLSTATSHRSPSDAETLVDVVLSSRRIAHVPAQLERRHAATAPGWSSRLVDHLGTRLAERLSATDSRDSLSCRPTDTGFEVNSAVGDERDLVIILGGEDAAELQRTLEACLNTTRRTDTDVVILRARQTSPKMDRYLDRIGSMVDVENDEHANPLRAANALIARRGADYGYVTLVESGIYPSEGWHESLMGLAARADVGVAAPVLMSAGDVTQSSGLLLRSGSLVHSHQGTLRGVGPSRSLGWHHALVSRRNQAAATSCVMMRMAAFTQAGGLDPLLRDSEAIADLCLRLGRMGLPTVIDPAAVAHSRKRPRSVATSELFRQRWASAAALGDPYHHPLLDDDFAPVGATHFLAPVRVTSGALLVPGVTAEVAVDPVPALAPLKP